MTGTTCTADDLLRTVVDLRPTLLAEQAATERRTRYAPELHERFRAAGLYRVLQPRRFGGLELDLPTFVRLQREMARGCPSTAWSWALATSHAMQLGSYLPESAQQRIFAGGDVRCASSASGEVRAVRADGGWRLDGTVRYCSGIGYSTHFMGQAFADGDPERPLVFVAPRSAWTVLDDWGDVLGLRGSGSNGIVLADAMIPADQVVEGAGLVSVDVAGGTPGLELHGNPLYAGRALAPFTVSLAALAVGAGLGALDEFGRLMRSRGTSVPPVLPRIDDPDFQRWYGTALSRLAVADAVVLRCAEEHAELSARGAAGGKPYGEHDELRLTVVAREAIVAAWEAVGGLVPVVGSSALRAGERFERAWRDLSTIAGHRNTGFREPMYRRLAQVELGLPAG